MFGLSRPAARGADPLRRALDAAWAVIEFTPDGQIIDANPAFLKLVGYTHAELVGQHHRVLCPPEVTQSDYYRSFWTRLAAGEPLDGRFRRVAKGGKSCFLRASYMPVRDDADKVVRVMKLAVDVTDDATHELDARGKIDAISRVQAVIEFDTKGNILDANENFLKTMGWRLDEIKGRHHRIFMPDGAADTSEYAEFWRGLARGEPVTDEFRRRSKDGSDVWIQATYNPVKDRYGEVLRIVKFAQNITPRITSVRRLGEMLSRLAEGDLDAADDAPMDPAFAPLRDDVTSLRDSWRELVERMRSAMDRISHGSTDIRGGADDLSDRAERQAATLEEIAATVEELSATINATANNSRDGEQVVRRAAERTEQGQQVIEQATDAVRTIEESSKRINEINGAIESIAFQTNLLALNAAVEAARAGEAGKGFAVVASEVRNLAQRSSDAAADTTRLIKQSSSDVEQGAKLMASAVEVFAEIRGQVGELARKIAEINSANTEQASGVNEINHAMSELDSNTQRNAEISTRNASAARDLDQELATLQEMLAFFRCTTAGARPSSGARPAARAA
ncbi:methyl-accepting chemotaxis protein [uncultured Albimonas sp.]|uniref:methyl-accepting chemotaxis protein n=1 Tax=uncultured Albimonas sp. TaxID=1331701 RepID=UPI0030EF58AA|tara:strand:+ start:1188 stop:2888 length:1701 start_codon:yes stop_codon:yes gene_type:complete